MSSGKPIHSATSDTQTRFAVQAQQQPAAANALAAHQSKPSLPYAPTGCPPLAPMSVTAKVTAAASPDAGLETKAGDVQHQEVAGQRLYGFTFSEESSPRFGRSWIRGRSALSQRSGAQSDARSGCLVPTLSDLHHVDQDFAWAIAPAIFAAKWSFPSTAKRENHARQQRRVLFSGGNLNTAPRASPRHRSLQRPPSRLNLVPPMLTPDRVPGAHPSHRVSRAGRTSPASISATCSP